MKKLKLKPFVLPTFIALIAIVSLLATSLITPKKSTLQESDESITYVSDTIIDSTTAVMDTSVKIINPYTDASIKIGKYFYDYKAEASKQEQAIVYHDGTYMQNSGIDFVNENVFDVVAVLNGEVLNVKDDETLGKIVEIKHDNDYITIYQSLSEVNVKKGDVVNQGQVIGKSGTNELDKEIGNHLHFEFYINGQVVDPTLYLNKELNKDTNNKE